MPFSDSRAEILYDESGDPVVDLKVQAAERFHLHYGVTWDINRREDGSFLRIYDVDLGLATAIYAPGAWQSAEVLRFYRKGEDPPEAET